MRLGTWLPWLALGLAGPAGAEPPRELDPIVVSASRGETVLLDTPASVDRVEGRDMRARRMRVNLSEGLGAVPGLQIQNRQNYAQDLQVSMRGFGARSTFGVRGVRLYVDGIPATMPDGQGQTSSIDIDSVDRVEVLRGPFSALYGNSSGGVIQVFTEAGRDPPMAQASAAAGSYGTYRYGAKASGRRGSLDYLLDATRFTTDGYRDHGAARKNLGNARLGLSLGEDSDLSLVVNHVDLRAQDPLGLTRRQYDDDPRASAPQAEAYDTRKSVRQTQGGLQYRRRITADDEFSAMLYFGQRRTEQFLSVPPQVQIDQPLQAGGVIDLKRDYGGADLRWTAHRRLAGRAVTVTAGLAYDAMVEQRKGYENFVDGPAGRELGVKGAPRRDETNRVWNVDPYLQASWRFAERWTAEAGLRYSTVRFRSDDHYETAGNGDDSGDARYRKPLPVAALRYTPTPRTSLYVSYGRGFETPTLNEISYRPGGLPGLNFGLRPATSASLEAGVKQELGGGLLTAAVFHTRTEDEIVTDANENGRATFRNAGRTRRDGLELAWSGELGRDWRAALAFAWLNARYRDDVCGPGPCGPDAIRAGNRIPGIARQSAYAELAWEPPEGWRAGVEARYFGKVYVDDANSDAAPGYFVAALNAGYLWRLGRWELNAFARVDNLFDRKYAGSVIVNEDNGRYFEPAPGRNWSAGLSVAYGF